MPLRLGIRYFNMIRSTPVAIAEQLGQRLQTARLNQGLTQVEVAERAGVSRNIVLSAEKGKVQLENLVAILQALNLTDQLDQFLPPQPISPIQLAKLQGKQRQRAPRRTANKSNPDEQGSPSW